MVSDFGVGASNGNLEKKHHQSYLWELPLLALFSLPLVEQVSRRSVDQLLGVNGDRPSGILAVKMSCLRDAAGNVRAAICCRAA